MRGSLPLCSVERTRAHARTPGAWELPLGVVVIIAIAITGVTVFVKSGGRHPFNTLTGLPAALGSAAILLTLAGFVLGATLFGADYVSRALTTLLTWSLGGPGYSVPERPRVPHSQPAHRLSHWRYSASRSCPPRSLTAAAPS